MRNFITSKTMFTGVLFLFLLVFTGFDHRNDLKAESFNVTLSAGEYRLIHVEKDQYELKMEGFGNLLIPGKPMLPAKTFMIAIPPGAKVLSVTTNSPASTLIPGQYKIKPAPAVLPSEDWEEIIKESHAKWQHNQAD